MPHDSAHRAFGLTTSNEVATQQDSTSSYGCTHCVLIFKTRFYLYEHLHQVHGLGVEAALRDSGLKTLPQNKPKPENRSKIIKSDFAFNCKNCSFRSVNWSIFSAHKNQCSDSSNNESLITKPSSLFKQQQSSTGPKDTNNVKTTCKSTLKDVKMYSKSPQTITKYFTAASTMKSDRQNKEKEAKALRLEGSSLKSCGVFQVTATSIDMAGCSKNTTHLLSDLISDPTSAKPVDPFKEATLSSPSKRTSKESEEYIFSKKAKLEMDQSSHSQASNCADLSFEVSDDEEEVKDLVKEEAEATKCYFCKHCDFKSASIEHVYSHCEEHHPYLRYNSFYIEEKSNQSATFRCLECPIEFSCDTHLRNHYTENHPDAPDIFSLKSADLNLAYKCFICPFTSSILQSLRDHHKEKHPSHKIENPLLYCKYSSTQHSIYVTQKKISEDHKSLEILHPERSTTPCEDVVSPPLSPEPKHKAQDGTLYFCGKCDFNHKSVVVLHVHYKKCHPEEPITLDKIKQSVGAPSDATSAQELGMEVDLSHSTVKEEDCPSPLSDPENISADKKLQPALLTTELDNAMPSTLNEKIFFCDRCNFSSSNIKSVVSHHNAKHGLTTTIEDVLRHTGVKESKNAENVPNPIASVFPGADNLYYCQVCNYGNPSLKGLINHQNKLHHTSKSKADILEYTAKIHDQIEKSKAYPNDSILPSGLPLPLITGKTALYFCYFCNYRQKDLTKMNSHFFKNHKGCRVNPQKIVEHTSMIYERLPANSQTQSTEQNQEVPFTHVTKKMIMFKSQKSRRVSPLQARLKCFNCSYTSYHVYLMRKHLISCHKTKMSFSDIVQLCGTGAHFEPGYCCDICTFRGENVLDTRKHCIERHGRSLSIQSMSTQLYLSPDVCDPKKRGNSLKNAHTPDGISLQTYPEAYSCKACPFKGTSFSSITSHYQAVHPWGSLEDVGKSKKTQSQSNKVQVSNDCQQDFDSYQMPIDFDNVKSSKEEAKEYSCSYCPATFAGHGGLIIHVGMKHPDKTEEAPRLTKRLQIFKCRSCSYVHNIRSGVLAHAKMKHPNKVMKASSFYVESDHLRNVEMRVKNGYWKFCGYICKECSQIYSSKEKLNEHRKTHKHPMPNAVISAHDGPKSIHGEIWCQYCGLYCASAKELSDHMRVCQKNSSAYPCALCPDAFGTKVQLGIHYTKKHGEKAFFKHYAPLYNQPSNKTTAQLKEKSYVEASTMSQTEKLRMFKCPSCRYVNSRFHGTLTHCQMRHPNVVVRAETLKVVEMDVANMMGYLPGSKSYGGYRCKKCPLIYAVLKKLKKHCETNHSSRSQTSSQLSAHTQQQPLGQNVGSESASSSQTKCVSQFRHFFKCSICSYSTSILKSLGRHYRSRHGKAAYTKFYSPLFNQANKPKLSVKYDQTRKLDNLFEKTEETHEKPAPPQVRVYKCSICSYATPYRRYLLAHFRNRHKLDAKAIYKQMEKYKNWESTLPIGRFPCKKCLSVFFASKGRLLAHYGTVHTSELKMDFTIVANRTHRTTGVYRCNSCKQKLFGVKNLCKHLEQHRARLMKRKQKAMESTIVEVPEEDSCSLDPVEDEVKLQVRSDEIIKSPPVSTVSRFDAEVPVEPNEGRHVCLRCKRTFMSLKGLRSHERSHAAFAALDNLTTSDSQEHIDQYIVYRRGTTRPYMCTLCSYRTTVLALGKSHFLKKHRHVLNSAEVDKQFEEETQKVRDIATNFMNGFDGDEEPENSFLEPPDVLRQLKHYNVTTQLDPTSKTQDIQLRDPRMLPCEMCNFSGQHYSNMRRHYLRRHGKKLIRCKDCNFFTCFKQNLELHEQMGHSCVQSEPTHQKNLCCPFCLYQSKNKNNMIDHIVLHREERMVPIEVRRSKLSRYLEGIVFRCYKCTFTSGSADSLDSHMAKHNDIKPFKCRLCYFDCTQLKDLEAHLCDKHQVVRNHQLVGQVSLDQLEEREDYNLHEEEEDADVLFDPQNNGQALKTDQPNKEIVEDAEHLSKDNEGNENILKDKVSPENSSMNDISGQSFYEKSGDHTDKHLQLHENTYDDQGPTKVSEGISESSAVCVVKEDHAKVQGIAQILKANEEDQKQNNVSDNVGDPVVGGAAAIDSNQVSKSNSEMQNAPTEGTTDIGKKGLSPPSSVELQRNPEVQDDQQSFGGVNSNPSEEHTCNPPNGSKETGLYGEMPILEKYFKEQRFIFAQHYENSEKSCTKRREECIEEGSEVDDIDNQLKTQMPPVLQATDSVAAVHSPDAATMFSCNLCGRSLANTSELQRHMMRHGM